MRVRAQCNIESPDGCRYQARFDIRGFRFKYHGYAELLLGGNWVKATPAFNTSLCERFDVAPLEFDGRQDSLFQQFNRRGDRYMEYVRDRGHYSDVPLDELRAALVEYYPALATANGYDLEGRFEEEADGETG